MAVILTVAGIWGRVWYVHPDSALHSIQAGLDSCAAGDTVMAGPGTYRETIEWPRRAGIFLLSEAGFGATTIDGENQRAGIKMFNIPQPGPVVRGFAFTNCFSTLSGAAIRAENCAPLIADNWFEGNAARQAGAVYAGNASPIIRRCTFMYNASMQFPPGAVALGQNCPALIESCTVRGNLGGGIGFVSGTLTTVRHCNLSGNYGQAVFPIATGDDTADAKFNWWGDSSGPYHLVLNPDGQGDSVGDRVDFDPWRQQPIGIREIDNAPTLSSAAAATLVNGTLVMEDWQSVSSAVLLDLTGRPISSLTPGANRIRHLAAGVYFVRVTPTAPNRPSVLRKITVLH